MHEVELEGYVLLDLADEGAEVEVALEPREDADQHREAPQVDPHDALDVRVLHLDRHLAPVAQPAPMHLRQRGRGERRRIELGERRLDRPPELAAQERQEGREPPRRHAILQLREHLDVLRGQDVGARAHELADLDGETLEARGEPVGALGAAAMMARQAHAVAARPLDQLVAAVDARDERCESGEPARPEEHRRIVRARPERRNVACNREPPPASSAAVGDEAIQIGDRVVHLQVPGVFTVVARRGAFFEVENGRGLRMTVHQVALRRLDGPPPVPKDA